MCTAPKMCSIRAKEIYTNEILQWLPSPSLGVFCLHREPIITFVREVLERLWPFHWSDTKTKYFGRSRKFV